MVTAESELFGISAATDIVSRIPSSSNSTRWTNFSIKFALSVCIFFTLFSIEGICCGAIPAFCNVVTFQEEVLVENTYKVIDL